MRAWTMGEASVFLRQAIRPACVPQGAPTGRLLSYNPATRATHVVATHLWYANGVALSKDESFAAVVETNTQRVHRVWLSGAKVGAPYRLACSLHCMNRDVLEPTPVWIISMQHACLPWYSSRRSCCT